MTNDKIGNSYDLGSWKCGKGKTFTHIPTNFIMLFKIISITNHLIKRGRKSIALKKFNISRFWKFSLKKTLTLPIDKKGEIMDWNKDRGTGKGCLPPMSWD